MRIFLIGIGLLLFSFCVQLALWRIFIPKRQIRAVLAIFFCVPILLVASRHIIAGLPPIPLDLSAAHAARLLIFYVSCVLAYAALYSAIEQQSPTLAIVSYVAKKSECTETELFERFGRGSELLQRVDLLALSKLVISEGDSYRLTAAGRRVAKLFDYAHRLFGVERGG